MAGEDQPCGAAAHGPGGDADGQRGSGERGRLPGRGAADLAAGESEGAKDGESSEVPLRRRNGYRSGRTRSDHRMAASLAV